MPRMVSPDPAPTTLGAALRCAAQTAPDRPLLRMAEGEWTTAAMDAQSDRMARYEAAAERLKASGRLYPCLESEEEKYGQEFEENGVDNLRIVR